MHDQINYTVGVPVFIIIPKNLEEKKPLVATYGIYGK